MSELQLVHYARGATPGTDEDGLLNLLSLSCSPGFNRPGQSPVSLSVYRR
jgi:hypothetical protein